MLRKLKTAAALALFACFLGGWAYVISSAQSPYHQATTIAASGTNQQPSKNQPSKSLWERTLDDPVALYTFVLSMFTGALVVVSTIQILFLIRADNTARVSADAAKAAAEKQIALTGHQADILDRQKEISRLQLIIENGPRLRVRNIVVGVTDEARGIWFEGLQLSGRCYVENIGGMTATVVESHLELYANQMGLPMESPYEGKPPNNVITGKFNVGESRPFSFTQRTPFAGEEAGRAFSGAHPFFVLGWINYRDDTAQGMIHGAIHRLAFCRRWDRGSLRFVPIKDDPDYEHEG